MVKNAHFEEIALLAERRASVGCFSTEILPLKGKGSTARNNKSRPGSPERLLKQT